MEKRCGRCGVVKALTEFTPKGKGRQSYCRCCVTSYFQEYYQKHKAKYVERANRYHQKIAAELRQAKEKPCTDWGRSYRYYVMEFDHRPGEVKLFHLSDLLAKVRTSREKMRREIAKCDVVCANCHRERTYQRKQNWPEKYRESLELQLDSLL